MATLAPTPNIGLVLPEPNTNEPFSTAVVNGLFTQIDSAFGSDRARLAEVETKASDYISRRDLYLLPTAATPGLAPGGNAAQRNEFWGVPADAAQRLSLARRGARWYNTERGWEEAYYARNDDGAGELGTRDGGWFPIAGRLPITHRSKNDGMEFLPSNPVIHWNADGFNVNGIPYDNGTGRFTPNQKGLYRITAKVGMTNNTANFQLRVSTNGNVMAMAQGFGAATGNSDLNLSIEDYYNGTSDYCVFNGASNTNTNITPGPTTAFMTIEYIRPY